MQKEKIIKIKSLGKKQTYDIEVDSEKHIFYGNGIATSNSHATTYGYLSYATAYYKYHFPLLFFNSWLYHSKEKINPTEERRDIIAEAKRFGISVLGPTIEMLSNGYGSEFFAHDKNIHFGLIDVKGIGYAEIGKLVKSVKDAANRIGKKEKDWTWFEFLCNVGKDIKKTVINNMILVGAIPGLTSRKKMVLDYKIYTKLNDKERDWLLNNFKNYSSLSEALKSYKEVPRDKGGPYNSASVRKIEGLIQVLDTNTHNLEDDPGWVAANESHLLGISINCHTLDDYDNLGDTTCKELFDGKNKGTVFGLISSVRETVTKKGKNPGQKMCFLKIEDKTESIDVVCFPNIYKEQADIIFEGAVVLAKVKRSDTGKGFILNSITRG
jgi:DNA polymerase-3 subunit alpha